MVNWTNQQQFVLKLIVSIIIGDHLVIWLSKLHGLRQSCIEILNLRSLLGIPKAFLTNVGNLETVKA